VGPDGAATSRGGGYGWECETASFKTVGGAVVVDLEAKEVYWCWCRGCTDEGRAGSSSAR
jgi:hypothetical protein